jgi:hypothetical protein
MREEAQFFGEPSRPTVVVQLDETSWTHTTGPGPPRGSIGTRLDPPAVPARSLFWQLAIKFGDGV